MRKFLEVVAVMLFIVVVIAGLMAVAYVAGGAADRYLGWGGWHFIVNVLVLMLAFVMIIATLLTLAERKWSAMMQDRIGPNRALILGRPLGGLGHVAADSVKMLFKEDFAPSAANPFLFKLGPILAFAPVFALFAVVPAGPTVEVFGQQVDGFISNPNFGLLYVFAIASLAVYGTSLAGWSSNNKFALLGGVRASSQMISYEVALGLSLVGMMLTFSSVQLPALTDAQAHYIWGGSGLDVGLPAWGIFLQPLGFILFFAAAFAETKRAPFDVPEGESEIIGYFVEYSGMKFGMFMISEFVEVVVLSAISTALFFGGYHLGWFENTLHSLPVFQNNGWLWAALLGTNFWVKVILLCWVQLLIRWTLPRFRYDQIQALGWKMLLPAGLINLFVTAALVLWDDSLQALTALGLLELFVLFALTLSRREPAGAHAEAHGHGAAHGHAHPVPAPSAGH